MPDKEAVVDEARNLMEEQKYAEALDMMRGLVEAYPDDPDTQSLYGEALIASGQPSLAVWPLVRAMRDPDQLLHAGLLLARAQIESGSGADAIKTATRILDVEPESQEALLLRIHAYLEGSLEIKALEDIDRLEKMMGKDLSIDFLRLDALLGLDREAESDALFKDLEVRVDAMREDEPAQAARLCTAIATFTFERGDTPGAKSRFGDCLKGDGFLDPFLFRTATQFFDEHGDRERATSLFKKRFEHDPSQLVQRVRYADRLRKVGHLEDGEKLLLEVVERDKAAWAALADLYAIEGDLRKAVDALDKAIAADATRHDEWFFSRADFLLELGDLKEAKRTLESIEVPAHRALIEARIASVEGNLDEAAKRFEEGIKLWPDNPDAHYLAGQVYERRGEWSLASAHYREAARMDKPHYESSLALADLQRALGDEGGVDFLLLRLADARPGDPKVAEKLIEHAVDTGNNELGMRSLRHLSQLPGQAGRAVALAAERAEVADGTEAALRVIDELKLDLSEPENFDALEARCELLARLERGSEGLASVEKALKRDPESARVLVLRAKIRRGEGDLEPAVADLETARKLQPRYIPGLIELARLRAELGERDAARALYEDASRVEFDERKKSTSGKFKGTIALFGLDLAAGEPDKGRTRLRAILAADPRQGEAAWLLLQSYLDPAESGQLDDKERADLALRAALFDGRPEAKDYLKRLKASNS